MKYVFSVCADVRLICILRGGGTRQGEVKGDVICLVVFVSQGSSLARPHGTVLVASFLPVNTSQHHDYISQLLQTPGPMRRPHWQSSTI